MIKEELELYRNLRVRTTIDEIRAWLYKNKDTGVVYFTKDKENYEPVRDYVVGLGCSSCKHCVFNCETKNEKYYLKPLPSLTCGCKKLNETYGDDYDITFRSSWEKCRHAVCDRFEPVGVITDDWNINQYIDIQNSCIVQPYMSIQGFSYKGKQIPMRFKVSTDDWNNNTIVHSDNTIKMYKPELWIQVRYRVGDNYYSGVANYIKQHNIIDKAIIKDIKEASNMNVNEFIRKYNGASFSLDTMWFI